VVFNGIGKPREKGTSQQVSFLPGLQAAYRYESHEVCGSPAYKLRDFVYLTYPFRLPQGQVRSTVESSFTGNGKVQQDQLIISKKMFAAVKVLSQALIDMKGQYYRDNILDVFGMSRDAMGMGAKAEDETYPLYERLSFGRYSAMLRRVALSSSSQRVRSPN
jgi:hypothetical protein